MRGGKIRRMVSGAFRMWQVHQFKVFMREIVIGLEREIPTKSNQIQDGVNQEGREKESE